MTPPTRAPVARLPEAYSVGDGVDPWAKVSRPAKTACVARYGAIGDHFIASSVLPHLKDQGYHITYNGNERALWTLARNPYIDRFFIQQDGHVGGDEMDAYWGELAPHFDRFVNLTESIEGTLLPTPSREAYWWPLKRRQRELAVNYLERTHDIAEAPHSFRMAFHPTKEERARAKRTIRAAGRPFIVWVLSGSSVHKHWPYLDNVLAALMLHTDATVALVGGHREQIAEVGWEKEPRVLQKAGRWSIRNTVAIAQQADVVVGPETGFMNAVALEPDVAKVLFLSHSAMENCGKHWTNTRILTPDTLCDCYPCHRLHYGWDTCNLDYHNGGALCQTRIHPSLAYSAIRDALDGAKEAAA